MHRVLSLVLVPMAALAGGAMEGPPSSLLIYGSTPAGVAAAAAFRAAAGPAASILLLDPGTRVGGMCASGLGNSDVRTAGVVGGFARDFFLRNARAYDPAAANPLFLLEPHVAERLFLDTLAFANATLVSGVGGIAGVARQGATLVSVTTTASPAAFAAQYFVDASYEGDLLAAAGATFALGREPRSRYNEPNAGRLGANYTFLLPISPYDAGGALLPLMSTAPFAAEGEGDGLLQAFCFRLCVTNVSANRRPFPPPAAFSPARFELFRRWVAASPPALSSFFGYAFPIPGGPACCKFDLNSDFAVSFDFVGGSAGWPTANASARRAMWEAHREYALSLIHVLQRDPATPPGVRAEALQWGLCADEFPSTDNWPPQLYVREGRRLVGDAVLTGPQLNTGRAPRGDSVGLGSYATDVHHVERVPCLPRAPLPAGPFPGPFPPHAAACDPLQPNAPPPPRNATVWVAMEGHGGDISAPHAVFELPYALLLPQRAQARNLLAPTAPSASHVAFNSIRMEAQFMALGQAAGAAAALARGGAVQDVDVPALQAELVGQGARLHWSGE